MTCKDLKNKILEKTLDDSFLVFIYSDNRFLVNQYLEQICLMKKLSPRYISSVDEIPSEADDFFGMSEDVLYVILADKFVLNDAALKYKNTVVISKEVTNVLTKKEDDSCIVVFDKLTKDQIKEYMEVLCPGLTLNLLDWLYDATNGDIYRIQSEMLKISIFPDSKQEELFNQIKEEGGYRDLSPLTIYNFINAFMKKDRNTILEVLQHINYIDIEGTGVVTLLTRNIKNCLDVQLNPRATAASLKMSEKQFRAVKYSVGTFSDKQLLNMYRLLTNIDYRLKSGKFELNNIQMVDYLVTHLMGVGY